MPEYSTKDDKRNFAILESNIESASNMPNSGQPVIKLRVSSIGSITPNRVGLAVRLKEIETSDDVVPSL